MPVFEIAMKAKYNTIKKHVLATINGLHVLPPDKILILLICLIQ